MLLNCYWQFCSFESATKHMESVLKLMPFLIKCSYGSTWFPSNLRVTWEKNVLSLSSIWCKRKADTKLVYFLNFESGDNFMGHPVQYYLTNCMTALVTTQCGIKEGQWPNTPDPNWHPDKVSLVTYVSWAISSVLILLRPLQDSSLVILVFTWWYHDVICVLM